MSAVLPFHLGSGPDLLCHLLPTQLVLCPLTLCPHPLPSLRQKQKEPLEYGHFPHQATLFHHSDFFPSSQWVSSESIVCTIFSFLPSS